MVVQVVLRCRFNLHFHFVVRQRILKIQELLQNDLFAVFVSVRHDVWGGDQFFVTQLFHLLDIFHRLEHRLHTVVDTGNQMGMDVHVKVMLILIAKTSFPSLQNIR